MTITKRGRPVARVLPAPGEAELPSLYGCMRGTVTMSEDIDIDRPILELLKIDEDTSLNVITNGNSLIIAPVRDQKRKKRIQEAIARGHRRYAKTFRRLAE